jgi:uncharacterized protein with NAD-binding domain and iron-sulfur cluster
VVEQVALCVSQYNPLITVNKVPCWPSQPRWEQIVNGDSLRKSGVDLEAEYKPSGARSFTLRKGTDADFDIVVLGISVAALSGICDELYRDDKNFANMIDNSRTTMTQAFQIWMSKDLKTDLLWPFSQDFIMSTYVEPLDTYADMSHLTKAENWAPNSNLRSIQYFCGVLEDERTTPKEDQKTANARIRLNAINYLQNDAGRIWPGVLKRGNFDWGALVDLKGKTGEDRFDSQFWRANF